MKNVVKLNESQLRKLVSESVKRVLKEYGYQDEPEYSGLKQYINSPDWEGTDSSNEISLFEYGFLINSAESDGDAYKVVFKDGHMTTYSISDLIGMIDRMGKRKEFCQTSGIGEKSGDLEKDAHDYPAYFFSSYFSYFGK